MHSDTPSRPFRIFWFLIGGTAIALGLWALSYRLCRQRLSLSLRLSLLAKAFLP